MKKSNEQFAFEIKPAIEQMPFTNPATQSFFRKWCEINSAIIPQIISRKEWDQRAGKSILEKNSKGQTLFLPRDLQLWEMVGVMESVDRDTFALNPEKQTAKKEQMLALGKMFQNAGAYIAQRLDAVDQGKEIASALAEEFYQYGDALAGEHPPQTDINSQTIAQTKLDPKETEAVDQWLAGDSLYRARLAKAEKLAEDEPQKDKIIEQERQKTLAQFFRVAEKAFALKQKSKSGELQPVDASTLQPWQSRAPLHTAFLQKTRQQITREIETPKRELTGAIFRRGMEKLLREMREPKDKLFGWRTLANDFFEALGINLSLEQKKLYSALRISKLKKELAHARQTGDKTKIGAKEREIALKIQAAVSEFPYARSFRFPAKILDMRWLNCVGASTLGGALLAEVGIKYMVGSLPEHSILVLITSDDKAEWLDMQAPEHNEEITDTMIKGKSKSGKPLTAPDIVAYAKNPSAEGLRFDITTNKIGWIKKGQPPFFSVLPPEIGQRAQILNSLGVAFNDGKNYEQAAEAFSLSIAIAPKFSYPYNGLGNALLDLGRWEEAIKAYRQAIAVDSEYVEPHNGLGIAFMLLGRYQEALGAYSRAIVINPEYSYSYYGLGGVFLRLGRKKDAVEFFQKYISLADKEKDEKFIQIAKEKIKKLQNE